MRKKKIDKLIENSLDADLKGRDLRRLEVLREKNNEVAQQIVLGRLIRREASKSTIPPASPNWEKVSAQIEYKRQSQSSPAGSKRKWAAQFNFSRVIPLASAVTAALIVTLTVFVVLGIVNRETNLKASPHSRYLLCELNAAEDILKSDLKILKKQTGEEIDSLPHDLQAVFNKTKADLNENILLSHEYLLKDPQNEQARMALFRNYRQQIRLYREFFEINKREEV